MDLGTVRQKLAAGEYSMPGDFQSDIELIFSNAKLYNGRGSEVSESSYWREISFGSQKQLQTLCSCMYCAMLHWCIF